MKEVGLCSSAVLALLFATTYLSQGSRPAVAASRRQPSNQVSKETADVWSNPAALRWRRGEPAHWRAMLLNH
jgi:hypothetical protein